MSYTPKSKQIAALALAGNCVPGIIMKKLMARPFAEFRGVLAYNDFRALRAFARKIINTPRENVVYDFWSGKRPFGTINENIAQEIEWSEKEMKRLTTEGKMK